MMIMIAFKFQNTDIVIMGIILWSADRVALVSGGGAEAVALLFEGLERG